MFLSKKVEQMYKSRVFTRYDDSGLVKYFTNEDFEGLNAVPYSFKSSKGHTLYGNFYSYDNYDKDRLIIFEHGMGGGHLSYMKEIEILCKNGYLVFSYDHTGCMKSGGENTNGFSQSLCDLDDCLKALKADENINTSNVCVIGHSWGGFSALNICALHPDIKKTVVLSGFCSVEKMIEQFTPGIAKIFRKNIYQIEKNANPYHVDFNGIDSLKNSNTKALLIYSDNDTLVTKKTHYDELYSALKDNPNVEFLLETNKGHNANYTHYAVEYLSTLGERIKKSGDLKTPEEKEKFKNSFDWDKMTAQDEKVWKKILDFLK